MNLMHTQGVREIDRLDRKRPAYLYRRHMDRRLDTSRLLPTFNFPHPLQDYLSANLPRSVEYKRSTSLPIEEPAIFKTRAFMGFEIKLL